MKNHLTLAAIAALLSASTVHAGNPDIPVFPVVQIVPVVTDDWSGLYAGGALSFDSTNGEVTAFIDGTPSSFSVSNIMSVGSFAGYNAQFGNFVLGGEAAVFSGIVELESASNFQHQTLFDLKARAGYSFGNALAYGVIGNSFSNASLGNFAVAISGLVYGAGLDFQVSENMFVGAEYLIRDMDGTGVQDPSATFKTTLQSAQFRVGWKF